MSYAQINYSQHVGNGPYPISATGCFVTAFCNLLARFGNPIDPPGLNNYFNQHGNFIPSPEDGAGTRDDVSWGTVSAYDGQVVVVGVGGAGWPDSNDAIVEFRYKSPHTGAMVNHFCLVADHAAGIIVDSYDGATKHSPYGTPIAWAKYERHTPKPVAPPPSPATPAYTIEHIPERTEQLKVTAHLWDLNQRSWPALVNNPVGTGQAGTQFKTSAIAHQLLGGSYYMLDPNSGQGYNIVDCQDAPPPPPPPPPVVAPPVAAPVAPSVPNTTPNAPLPYPGSDEKYVLMANVLGFQTSTQAAGHTGTKPVNVPAGSYFIYNRRYLNNDAKQKQIAINITKTKGQPGAWINPDDNVLESKSAAAALEPAPAPKPAPEPVVTPAAPVISPTLKQLQDNYVPFPKKLDFSATRDINVPDLSGKSNSMVLPQYATIGIYGTTTLNGIDYYRARIQSDANFDLWYCIEKIDPVTHKALLLAKPMTTPKPVTKRQLTKDSLHLLREQLEEDALQFIDIVPKWLGRTKK